MLHKPVQCIRNINEMQIEKNQKSILKFLEHLFPPEHENVESALCCLFIKGCKCLQGYCLSAVIYICFAVQKFLFYKKFKVYALCTHFMMTATTHIELINISLNEVLCCDNTPERNLQLKFGALSI